MSNNREFKKKSAANIKPKMSKETMVYMAIFALFTALIVGFVVFKKTEYDGI